MKAQVTHRGALDMQVCVPYEWDDAQVKEFADRENPCGTSGGWFVRKDGDEALAGDPERARCQSIGGHVHIMLDA